jgi:hypothetical protein
MKTNKQPSDLNLKARRRTGFRTRRSAGTDKKGHLITLANRDEPSISTLGPEVEHALFALWEPHGRRVFVAGDFNAWNPSQLPLRRDGDGCWVAEVPLPQGRHQYLFVVDGEWRPDPESETVPNGVGGVHSVVNVPFGAFAIGQFRSMADRSPSLQAGDDRRSRKLESKPVCC